MMDLRDMRWWLKHRLQYSPTVIRKRGITDPDSLASTLGAAASNRLQELRAHYDLGDWPRLCNRQEYVENLYLLDLLDRHLPPAPPGGIGLDIGCRSFCHLPALASFMPGAWTGVELDAHARYLNGYTRAAYGQWMARQREGCRYMAGSLLDLTGHYDVIVWLLPFVLPGPLKHWGLPQRYFQPMALLQHAASLLKPGGVMLVVNQGEEEQAEQKRLFDAAGIEAQSLDAMTSPFSPFQRTRYGWRTLGRWASPGAPG